MQVPKATADVFYNGKNITEDISPYLKTINYTDKTGGEADELEIVLEDKDDLWKNKWYPTKGDTIKAAINFNGTLDCGQFTIDEITSQYDAASGDEFIIKALAAGIDKKIRTKKSYAHENKSLREIANTIAKAHGFTVNGTIKDVTINRVTQYRKTDLRFLTELAQQYGYTFAIKGKTLVFTDIYTLEKKESALTLRKEDLISGTISDKTSESFQAVDIKYHNSQKKKLIQYGQRETNTAFSTKEDTLQLYLRAENKQQAELKARALLYQKNSKQQSGNISFPGNVLAMAGNNCILDFENVFGGLYYIEEAQHSIDGGGGYVTEITIKRVGKK